MVNVGKLYILVPTPMSNHTSKLYIIDTIGPFFIENQTEDRSPASINWSKVPFAQLESGGRLTASTQSLICKNFRTFVQRISGLGYNSLSLDDLAHMAKMPFYSPSLQTLLRDYRRLYLQLCSIAREQGLQIFVNTDYMFTHPDIEQHLQQTGKTPIAFFEDVLRQVFQDFPQIDGIILRLGENDGKDVHATFQSHLALQTPEQANRLLAAILPTFEARQKQLIVRTWTVGVYRIGDLIWNPDTYDRVFGSITSDALTVSLKFGDTDFMRYLPLNPLFFHGPHKKILELQTRREWEGMGTLPSFVGWDYERYLRQLDDAPLLVGIQVWCQTGGWAKRGWDNLTYLAGSSFWNELNTEVTLDLARLGTTTEQAIQAFCQRRSIADADRFIALLRHAEVAIKQGLYLPEFAHKQLYFRRTRIPPLLGFTWDTMLWSPLVRYIQCTLVQDPQAAIDDSTRTVEASKHMLPLAQALKLPDDAQQSLEFTYETMRLLAQIRRHTFQPFSSEKRAELHKDITRYEQRYPQHYTLPKPPDGRHQWLPRLLLPVVVRQRPSYRLWDRFLLRTSPLQLRLVRLLLRRTKSRLADQSMGFEVFFK